MTYQASHAQQSWIAEAEVSSPMTPMAGQLQLGELAHDLNNVLAVVCCAAHLAARADVDADQRNQYAGAITEAALRAGRLSRTIIDVVRGRERDIGSFDVCASLAGSAGLLSVLAGSRIRLGVDLPAGPAMVRGDAEQFDAALVNLVTNARDSIDGTGRIQLSAKPVMRDGERVIAVAVSDTGCGIPPEQVDRIFDPFFTSKGACGTGLGLAQVMRFARQAGGDVAVRSSQGLGSTFLLSLPLVGRDDVPRPHCDFPGVVLEGVARHLD